MEKAYKFRMYPNKQQEELINKTFGCCRFIYNRYLAKRLELYENNKETYSYNQCSSDLTNLKKVFSRINIIFLNNIYKNCKFLTLIVFEVVVHIKTLLFMQFSYELLNISIKHRLYLILQHYLFRSTHFHYQ